MPHTDINLSNPGELSIMADHISPDDLRFFDRSDDFEISFSRLPHWSQPGTVAFITWRTADSMPRDVLEQWIIERDSIVQQNGLDPASDWRSASNRLPAGHRMKIKWDLIARFDGHLDKCHGACPLKDAGLAQIIADSLNAFEGERYVLTDFVIMPNHVHLMAAFSTPEMMRSQIAGWKRFQARQINIALERSGHFWQEDDFDHLVRSESQVLYYRKYIADNPRKARLKPGEFLHWSREL